jgi:hypothetical protein
MWLTTLTAHTGRSTAVSVPHRSFRIAAIRAWRSIFVG